jgi:hypothetical protein
VIEFNGIVVANNRALVATDAFPFFNKGNRSFAPFGAGALLTSLSVEGRADFQGLLFTALP